MKCTDLRIHIRLARLSLGLDPYVDLPRSKQKLTDMLADLRREQRERGGILKVAKTDDEVENKARA